ncbi:hypothetical protein [Phyllobacterium pellucidum]|uniref:hypothetical protein n=1 Tax=Phyllobacterium pellucidum TaxID=2740464 RepID=UPI001D14C88F|nr:hypothetical protein [Phyllobacterium sp. T1018]UGY08312.1 hypothetical protein LLE51_009565 [Phyllobacterium sp. T1018]
MKLELRSIVAAGDLKNERLTLRALADLDVGDYLVAQSDYVAGNPTTNFYHTFWFPFKPIQKGDLVVIYTKAGTSRERVLDRGTKAHFYYFDLPTPIWNDRAKGALLLYAPAWQSAPVADLKKA